RELILKGVHGQSDVAAALAGSATLNSLELLILESCPVGDDGIARLCRAPFAAGLERLELVKCGITNAGAIHLARSWPPPSPLRHLELSENQIRSAGMSHLQDRLTVTLK